MKLQYRQLALIILVVCLSFFNGAMAIGGEIKTPALKKLIEISLERHPDMRMLLSEREKSVASGEIALQHPNPEFNSRLLMGPGDGSFSGEYAFLHTFELGGKRGTRRAIAQRQVSLIDRKILIRKQEIVQDLILSLYRLRQIKQEISLIDENIETYTTTLNRYKKLPALDPDNDISMNIYLLAGRENKERKKILVREQIMLNERISMFTGFTPLQCDDMVLPSYAAWPQLQDASVDGSPLLLAAREEIELNTASLENTRSLAWPDILIGPSVNTNTDRGKTSLEAGISFSLQLPVFHRYSGQIKEASGEVQGSVLRHTILRETLDLSRKTLLRQYNTVIENLSSLPLPIHDGAHDRLHRLMRRGTLSASLVIEYHRQEFASLTTLHENQITALTCLWTIFAIDGIIFREADNENTQSDD